MPPVWASAGDWSTLLQARAQANSADPPGNLWFQMTAPDGSLRRIHSGLVSAKLARGWTIGGEFVEDDSGEFPA
jgi:hypothetical protein